MVRILPIVNKPLIQFDFCVNNVMMISGDTALAVTRIVTFTGIFVRDRIWRKGGQIQTDSNYKEKENGCEVIRHGLSRWWHDNGQIYGIAGYEDDLLRRGGTIWCTYYR